MTFIRFAAAPLFGLVAATSTHAVEPDRASLVPVTARAGSEQATAAPAVPVKRYCISDRREGAPRRPKICRTRDDWRAHGFDPLVAIGQL